MQKSNIRNWISTGWRRFAGGVTAAQHAVACFRGTPDVTTWAACGVDDAARCVCDLVYTILGCVIPDIVFQAAPLPILTGATSEELVPAPMLELAPTWASPM
jgi:hypothetical protein